MQALPSSDSPAIDASISSFIEEKEPVKRSIHGILNDDRCLASDQVTSDNVLNRRPSYGGGISPSCLDPAGGNIL